MTKIKLLPPESGERKESALDRLYGPGYRDTVREKVYPQLFGLGSEFTIGLADEISGYTQAPIDWITGVIKGKPQDFSALLDERLELAREAQRAFRDEHPVASIAANVAGGAAALPARAAAAATSVFGGLVEGAKAGAIGGGLAGAAEGEGALGRAETGAMGAGIGATLGVVIPGGVELVSRIAAGLKNIAGLRGEGAKIRAQQMLLEALERDGIALDDLVLRARDSRPLTLADLGPNTRELVGAAGRRGSEGREAIETFLTERSKGAFGRIEDDIARGVGDPKAFRATDQALIAEKAKAGPLYQALHGKTAAMDDDLRALLTRPAARRAFANAQRWWANKGKSMPKDGSIPFEVLDQTKKEIDALARYGQTPQGGAAIGGADAIRGLNKEFRDLLDSRFPGYEAARKQSADPQQIRDALVLGRDFLRGDAADMAADFAALSDPEKEAFRLGAARALREKISTKSFTANTAKMFDNPKAQEQLKAIFPDVDTFTNFMKAVSDENAMQETFDGILRNSATARRQVADEEFTQGAAGLGDAAIDLLRGRGMVGTTLDWAARLGRKDRVAYGLNQRVGDEVARLGVNPDLPHVAGVLRHTRPMGVPAIQGPRGGSGAPAAIGGVGAAERIMAPTAQPEGSKIKILPPAEPAIKTTGDHVNLDAVAPQAKRSLTALQRRWGKELPVKSAYRDPAHNARVGGASRSRHMEGDAFDIDVSDLSLSERLRLLNMASEVGFTGIGVYGNSIHLDLGGRRAWGPSHKSDSVPKWAQPVIKRHLSRDG